MLFLANIVKEREIWLTYNEIASAQVNFSSFNHYRMYFFGYSFFHGLRNDAKGCGRDAGY